MSRQWYMHDAFDGFPLRCRLWIAWCRCGLKHRNGTTVAGSILFKLLRRWLRWLPAGTDNYWPVHGSRLSLPLVVDLLDLQSYIHTVPVLSRGSNEFELQAELLRPGMTFLDIGANYGLYTLHAAQRVGTTGRVIACEPQPRLVGALREAQRMSGTTVITVVAAAVSDRPGRATFEIPGMASGTGSLLTGSADNHDGSRHEVEVTTIDDLCRKLEVTNVHLIKIDVEGGEYKALAGAAGILRASRPLVWFELNPAAQAQAGVSIREVFRLLEDLGYRTFKQIARGYPEVRPDDAFIQLVNIIALPEGTVAGRNLTGAGEVAT